MINILETVTVLDPDTQAPLHRAVKIIVSKNNSAYEFHVGGLPLSGDLQAVLDGRFDELWSAAEARGVSATKEIIFQLAIATPALYAQDIFVSSRKVKDDPDEAFEEAKQETRKPKGEPKSLDLISRSTLKALEQSREKIKELEQTIAALDKRLKKLEK